MFFKLISKKPNNKDKYLSNELSQRAPISKKLNLLENKYGLWAAGMRLLIMIFGIQAKQKLEIMVLSEWSWEVELEIPIMAATNQSKTTCTETEFNWK